MKELMIHYQRFTAQMKEIENFIDVVSTQKQLYSEFKGKSTEISIEISAELPSFNRLIGLADSLNNSMVHYNAVIISIYGCFENYINEIAKFLVDFYYDNISNFKDLPKKMQNNYYKQLGDCLSNPQRFSNIDKSSECVLLTAYNNVFNIKNESLQMEFLINHGGNLTIDKVTELFNNLDIKELRARIIKNYLFIKYFSETQELTYSQSIEYLKRGNLAFKELTNLVEARNKVAHGWYVDSRISFDIIKNKIMPYLVCLTNVILEEILTSVYTYLFDNGKMIEYEKPIAVYDKTILCINSKQAKIKVDDYMFYKTTDNCYKVAKILSIEKEQVKINALGDGDVNSDIGICLDRPIKDSYVFYYC